MRSSQLVDFWFLASQIPADSFFMQLPPEAFREAFGYEWFIRRDKRDIREDWIFDSLGRDSPL